MNLFVVAVLLLLFSFLNAEKYEYNISMFGLHVGSSIEKLERVNKKGKCLIKLSNKSNITLSRGTSTMRMKTDSFLVSQCDTFAPVSFKSRMENSGTLVFYSGKKVGNKFYGSIKKNGREETSVVEIPDNTVFFSMMFKKYASRFFKNNSSVSILSEDSFQLKKLPFKTTQENGNTNVTVDYSGVPITFILDKKGVVVQSHLQGGVLVYRLKGAAEKLPLYKKKNSSGDILEKSSITNYGIKIEEPRKATKVSFLIEGVSGSIPAFCSQKVEKDGDKILLTVDSTGANCVSTDLPNISHTTENIFEDSDSPDIKRVSRRWLFDKKPVAVDKVVKFVNEHITDKSYAYGTLSASEVLDKGVGDCTEHSTLFSALVKSINIPTRMLYGLVLSGKNTFFFHNWNEVFINGKWISVDSTFNQQKADAARIALIVGGNTSSDRERVALSVLKFLNGVKIKVTGYNK